MRYPAKFHEGKQGQLFVEFRDFPGFKFSGYATSEKEAISLVRLSLLNAIQDSVHRSQRIPMPSPPDEHEFLVELSLELSARILLLNEVLSSGLEPSHASDTADISLSDIQVLSDFNTPIEINRICERFKRLGKHLEVRATSLEF